MDFLNKLTEKITSGASTVANKTKDIAGTTKINFQISEDQKEREKLYTKLGKRYFEENGKAAAPQYKELIDNILELNDKIEQEKLEIQKIKGVTVCENCGAELTEGTKFCSKCGANVIKTEEQVEVVNEKIVCPTCGHEEEADVSFCSACGCKLK